MKLILLLICLLAVTSKRITSNRRKLNRQFGFGKDSYCTKYCRTGGVVEDGHEFCVPDPAFMDGCEAHKSSDGTLYSKDLCTADGNCVFLKIDGENKCQNLCFNYNCEIQISPKSGKCVQINGMMARTWKSAKSTANAVGAAASSAASSAAAKAGAVVNSGIAAGKEAANNALAAGKEAANNAIAAGKDAANNAYAAGKEAVNNGIAAGKEAVNNGIAAGKEAAAKGIAAGKNALNAVGQQILKSGRSAISAGVEAAAKAGKYVVSQGGKAANAMVAYSKQLGDAVKSATGKMLKHALKSTVNKAVWFGGQVREGIDWSKNAVTKLYQDVNCPDDCIILGTVCYTIPNTAFTGSDPLAGDYKLSECSKEGAAKKDCQSIAGQFCIWETDMCKNFCESQCKPLNDKCTGALSYRKRMKKAHKKIKLINRFFRPN